MADVKGLLADPEFQGLDPATKKQVLGRIDKDFNSLNDAQFTEFIGKTTPPKQESPGLIQRAKDYFSNIPVPEARHPPARPEYSGIEELIMGGIMPGESAPNVTRAVGTQLGKGRIGRFLKGVGEEAEKIKAERAPKPAPAPTPKAAAPKPAEFPPNSTMDPKFHGPIKAEPVKPPSQAPESAAPAAAPEAPKTSRDVRGTPEKQAYSDLRKTKARLQASMTHAQNLFKAGQTASKLKALNPAEKKELMIQLFGRERPEVWESMIDDLRGIETGKVKPI